MYVCLCKGITDTQIRAAVEDGANSIREVRNSLGVASQCGKCGILAREIVRELGVPVFNEEGNGPFYACEMELPFSNGPRRVGHPRCCEPPVPVRARREAL